MIHADGAHGNVPECLQLLPILIGAHPLHRWKAPILRDKIQTGNQHFQKILRQRTNVHTDAFGRFFVKPIVVAVGVGEQQAVDRPAVKDYGEERIVRNRRVGIRQIGPQVDQDPAFPGTEFGTAAADLVAAPMDDQSRPHAAPINFFGKGPEHQKIFFQSRLGFQQRNGGL